MPEIDKCRKCASCCHICIFLDFNEDDELYSCLIYRNKHRFPLQVNSVKLDLGKNKKSEYWRNIVIEKLLLILEGEDDLCHTYMCKELEKEGKLRHDINDNTKFDSKVALNSAKRKMNIINKARKLIPNFYDLVDILNEDAELGECDIPFTFLLDDY